MVDMTRGKAIIFEDDIDTNKIWGGTRTSNVTAEECLNAIADSRGQPQKDGLSIPAHEEYPAKDDAQGDPRRYRVVKPTDKVKNGGEP